MEPYSKSTLNIINILKLSYELYFHSFKKCLIYISLISSYYILLVLVSNTHFNSIETINISIIALKILIIPLVGGFYYYQNNVLKKEIDLYQAILYGFNKTIPLVMSIIYISFIPLIICISCVFAKLTLGQSYPIINNYIIGLALILCSLILGNKVLTPIIVMVENLDTIDSYKKNNELSKHYYFQYLILGYIPFAIELLPFLYVTSINWLYKNTTLLKFAIYHITAYLLIIMVVPLTSAIKLTFYNKLKSLK